MKRLLLIFLAFPVIARAQLCFDFESGEVPQWEQSRDSAWTVSPADALGGNFSLWHFMDDSVSGEDRISFAYDSLVLSGSATTWQFTLRHAYSPSSSNKWAVFLVSESDQAHMMPGGGTGAIVLGVNFSGSDDRLKLWRTVNGKADVIAETSLNWQDEIGTAPAVLRVERTPGRDWSIYMGGTPGNESSSAPSWELIGQGNNPADISPGHFGIYYHFSSRQDRKFWFDDLCIEGCFIRDTIPPFIKAVELKDGHILRIVFSENLDSGNALSPISYSVLPGGIRPDSILAPSGGVVDLVFSHEFSSGVKQILRVEGVGDRKGNVSGILEEEFTWYRHGRGDIIFNEIMYDPFPEIGLPGYEYIELYNRSGYPADLGDWILQAGDRALVLPQLRFPPGHYLLICYRGMKNLYGDAFLSLDALNSRTFLSNEGSALLLSDPDSVLIDWIEYSPGMHGGEYYAEGGWSLERIDMQRTCHGADNWTSSRGRLGGTPGIENSVRGTNPDRDPPDIRALYAADSQNLVLEFNEAMDGQSVLQQNSWFIDGGMGLPDSIHLQSPANRILTLHYRKGFAQGREYSLEVPSGVRDCSGNRLTAGSEFRFALPVLPGRTEIFLSEILFNPWPYCPDFIEVFNGSEHAFDLADLRLANRDPESGGIVSAGRVADGHHLFFPGDFIVFTGDPESLCGFYTVHEPECLVKVADMPKMGDAEGSVILLDKYLEVLDELDYNRNMHHPLLSSQEGVSLERISYRIGAEYPSNWHSASSSDGFGTPGRRNSQSHSAIAAMEGFEVEPEIFTPDMDGIEDVLLIKYRFSSPGLRARILIIDPRGRLVREIASRELLGTEGFYTWDGTDHLGRRARTGIYLVLVEVSGMEPGISRYRKTCVLATGR